jgi:hypothetical protein
MISLTPHFTLGELIRSDTANQLGIDNEPKTQGLLDNLLKTAQLLEEVRAACDNHPVMVSSGYRCRALNDRMKGSYPTSPHIAGMAADFSIPAFGSPFEVARRIVSRPSIKFEELILEGFPDRRYGFVNWVHIAWGRSNAMRLATIDINGRVEGLHDPVRG